MDEQTYRAEPAQPLEPTYARRPGSRLSVLLLGLLVGAVIMTVVWVAVAGNPLSDVNEIVYREVLVDTISQDRLCWAEEPQRRDTALRCAILTLDPQQALPDQGDRVTIGVTTLRPAGGEERLQVVYAAPAEAAAPTDSSSDAGSEPPG
jgi:hypothetical protein